MIRRHTGRANARPRLVLPFDRRLVVNQWLLSLFGASRFEDLAEHLRDEALEGLDQDNVHRFHHALTLHVPPDRRPELPDELLLEYDQNIVGHTQRLNYRRVARGEQPIRWKYFQYLALLFTEIYLDRYFRDPDALLRVLNEHVMRFNAGCAEADGVAPFAIDVDAPSQLNKLAFWMATGSGKTLVMHANILQYRDRLDRAGRTRGLNRIILLTPNEGLSQQHLRELETAGIEAEIFSKDGRGLFAGRSVEILDIHKLKEEMGEKTVAVDAFEGNNLVLVDEGHRGASAGEQGAWLRFRSALCERGFSFEYSATFAQAVKGDTKLADAYAKSVLFDYSYRYFYNDGFGKDYQIANLEDDSDREWMDAYLTACLLTFYQQLRLHQEREPAFRPFQIEKPLWVFVGGSVTKTLAARDASDIVEILKFLVRYVGDGRVAVDRIRRVLANGLVTARGSNLFAGRFAYLNTSGLTAEQVFEGTLALVFNAPGGGSLHVENLKGATGEVALRIGENEPFGVINVGDDAKLVKLCKEHGFDATEREFGGSLFHEINESHSTINMLIGSRKFTEGWNSWRVSTMGLMNIGRGEGAQIIQLFGRGVRLKGFGHSLKRSGRATLEPRIEPPWYIEVLETLSIFGVRADYMAQFRDYLKDEGLSTDDRVEFILPVICGLGDGRLKTVGLKQRIGGVRTDFGDAFRRLGPIPTVGQPDPRADPATAWLQDNQVVLNWYPKIQAMHSLAPPDEDGWQPEEAVFERAHVALLDIDRLFFELERFKAERGWFNLNLTRAGIRALLGDTTWYRLQIPAAQMAFDSMERVRLWQEIAASLLKRYVERYYSFRKRAWELPHLEYRPLTGDDPNLPRPSIAGDYSEVEIVPSDRYYYRVLVEESKVELIAKLGELRQMVEQGDFRPWEFQGVRAVWADQHLYRPLLYAKGGAAEITPAPLNDGEARFVEDLHEHLRGGAGARPNAEAGAESAGKAGGGGPLSGVETYLLRNLSRGRGVGFFEAGNFHPDFILWLLAPGRQHIVFIDPKGIRNLGKDDPKIRFHETVKEVEARLGDPQVKLHSFIVANTPAYQVERLWGLTKAEIEGRGIVFQHDEGYVGEMLRRVLEEQPG